ncbi:MAG: hypothetical protein ACTSYD_01370 [Candidatus Heimdallarchaeaceae archaeon]
MAEERQSVIEEQEVRAVLNNMLAKIIEFCESDGKLSAPEKRIIKAMKASTKELADEIIALYKKQAEVDDMTLLEVVDRNREKILNDLFEAAKTPKGRISKRAKEVIAMVAQNLI